jgi:hypothetical protein
MTAALQLVCDYGFEGAGLRLIRWRAGWQLGVATCRGEGRLGLLWCCPGFAGAARRAAPRLDRHIGPRRSPGAAALAAQPWLRPIKMQGTGVRLRAFRGSDVDRIVEACSDRARHIGSSRCRGRTSVTTHWPTSSPSASWPRVVPAWRGA